MADEERKRLLFVLLNLEAGGAERMALNFLQRLDRDKFAPYLALFEGRGVFLDAVPEDVPIYQLGKRNRFSFIPLVLKLGFSTFRKVRPDVVLSFIEYTNFTVLLAREISFISPPIVISERNQPSLYQARQRLRRLRRHVVAFTYRRADRIISISRGIMDDLRSSFGIPSSRIRVVHNSVDISAVQKLSREPVTEVDWFAGSTPVFINFSRLKPQKNYQLLIRAFTRVRKEQSCRLLILGDGEERSRLETLAEELGIVDDVAFLGYQENPFRFVARSHAFVLSSHHEGFGNVITEAMACGTPVISTRCPSGPDEIITDGESGLLVPVDDIEALAEAMKRILEDKDLHARLSEAGLRRAQDFTVEKMVESYESVLLEAIDAKGK